MARAPLMPRERLLAWDEIAALAIVAGAFAIPMATKSVLVYSVLNHALIGVIAAQSVWIMLRMNLLTFASPAFMALGGYAVAIAGRYEIADAAAMALAAFLVPALAAIPLGALVLNRTLPADVRRPAVAKAATALGAITADAGALARVAAASHRSADAVGRVLQAVAEHHREIAVVAAREAERRSELEQLVPTCVALPTMPTDVHDLAVLRELGAHLLGASA